MVHQEGGERVFPVQLMTIRRSKNGTIRTIFLTSENSDYCSQTLNLFKENIGNSRSEIEGKLKILELKVQNPKVIKGLALIIFREARMVTPGELDPVMVRNTIFSKVRIPPVSEETRNEILVSMAEELHSDKDEVIRSMYGDLEREQILSSIGNLSEDYLIKKYNQEQVETVLLKSKSIELYIKQVNGRLIRKIRSLGLLYTEVSSEDSHKLEISGPISMEKHSERYGARLALFVRYLFSFSEWKLDSTVVLTSSGKKTEYRYSLDDSVIEYMPPRNRSNSFSGNGAFVSDPEGIEMTKNIIYPDYSIKVNDTTINIFITRPPYFEEDFSIVHNLQKEGHRAEIFCILDPQEKCPKGAHCMKGTFNFRDAEDYLREKNTNEKKSADKRTIVIPVQENHLTGKEISPVVIKHLSDLFPDSQAMVDYLDFMGFLPAETLEKLGYRVKWHGLRIEVLK
ncbi:MAG: DUF790 family protein [Cuniculiplasma sp.]